MAYPQPSTAERNKIQQHPDPSPLQPLHLNPTSISPHLEFSYLHHGLLGLLITDRAAAPIRGANDVDVITEIVTYADYVAFSERLREAHFTEDAGEKPLTCRWHHGALTVDVLALNEEVLGFTNIWYESALRHAFTVTLPLRLGVWRPCRKVLEFVFARTKIACSIAYLVEVSLYPKPFTRPLGGPTRCYPTQCLLALSAAR